MTEITFSNPQKRSLSGWQHDVADGVWTAKTNDNGQNILIIETNADGNDVVTAMGDKYPAADRL